MPAHAAEKVSPVRRFRDLVATARSYWPQRKRPVARVAINMAPRSTPYGGGNQFVQQLTRHLVFHGYEVLFHLDGEVDCILIIDGRDNLTTFGVREILAFKQRNPSVICIHRVNECDQRKQSDFMDNLLARVNSAADYTVFISRWLRDYHASRWFDPAKPNAVIHNGADPSVFHPLGNRPPSSEDAFRLVTHHWSDNPIKGFTVYEEIDQLIEKGELPNVELWVIGRWPAGMQWRSARLIGPVTGHRLADLLRQCHAYVTASLWEPGGMHFIEGAQCGLPVLYHMDGGGIVEVAEGFGIGFRDDVLGAIEAMRARYPELRHQTLSRGPSGDRMCMAYRQLIQALLLADGNMA